MTPKPRAVLSGQYCDRATGRFAERAEDGRSGVEKFQKLKPDVLLLDLSMPDMTGIETAHQMSAADPSVPLILFTVLEIEGIGDAARDAGIRTIVPKTEAWSLIPNIERIANEV